MTAAPVRRVGRLGVAWRLAVSVVGVVLLVNGSVRMTDDVFPFGPMSQYAFAPNPNGTVSITRIDGTLTDGRTIEIPLNWASGIRRADIEAQIPQIVRDPPLLSGVVDNWERHHPNGPRLTEVWLFEEQHRLSDPSWHPIGTVELARWRVPR